MVWRAGLHGLLPGRPSSAQRPADGLGPLRPYPHCLVADTNIFLHEIDFLEDPAIRNVIVLQIVLDEVKHRNLSGFATSSPTRRSGSTCSPTSTAGRRTCSATSATRRRTGTIWTADHVFIKWQVKCSCAACFFCQDVPAWLFCYRTLLPTPIYQQASEMAT